MSISADDIQQQIILEVGDVDPASGDPPATPELGIIAQRMSYLWARYAAYDQVAAGLREALCRRSAIRLVLGVLNPRRFDSSDTQGGLATSANQLVTNYQKMLELATDEIDALMSAAAGGAGAGRFPSPSSPYQSARLSTRAPIQAVRPPDPNDLRYGGAPGVVVPDFDADDDITSP